MTHEAKIAQWLEPGRIGTEIGAGGRPVPGLEPPAIQVDCFKAFGANVCEADYYGHACALPFHDHSLDYVISSHVLEHVANPVAALAEWYRVVRPGGLIYLVVPDRRHTWEHTRELTPVAHLLEDYERNTSACDATHIDDFVFQADWSRFRPDVAIADVPAAQAELAAGLHAAVNRGEDINIHFHTFEPSNLRELLETLTRFPTSEGRAGPLGPPKSEPDGPNSPALPSIPRFNWELVDFEDGFPAASPNGVLAVLRVHKGWRARADAEALRIRAAGDWRAVLRPDAQPFAAWAAETTGLGGVR